MAITTLKITRKTKNLKIGSSIDLYGNCYTTPFTKNSVARLEKEVDKSKLVKTGPIANHKHRKYTHDYKLSSSLSSMMKSKEFHGKVKGSVGIVSGEAEINSKKFQSATRNDLSFFLESSFEHDNIVCDSILTNQLKLNLNKMKKNNVSNLKQFKNTFGNYLIVGVKYGAKSKHQIKYSMKSKENYSSFSITVVVSVEAFGYTVGSYTAHHDKKVKRRSKRNVKSKIIEDYSPPEIRNNIPPKIERNLSKVANLNTNFAKEKTDDKNISIAQQLNNDFYEFLVTNAQPIEYILIPIETVLSITYAFSNIEKDIYDTKINLIHFGHFVAPLYYALIEIQNDLNEIKNDQDNKNTALWKRNVQKRLKEISLLKSENDIVDLLAKRRKWLQSELQLQLQASRQQTEIEKNIHCINTTIVKFEFQSTFMTTRQ